MNKGWPKSSSPNLVFIIIWSDWKIFNLNFMTSLDLNRLNQFQEIMLKLFCLDLSQCAKSPCCINNNQIVARNKDISLCNMNIIKDRTKHTAPYATKHVMQGFQVFTAPANIHIKDNLCLIIDTKYWIFAASIMLDYCEDSYMHKANKIDGI